MTGRRKLLVVLHVLTSVSGVGAALSVLLLLVGAASTEDTAGQDTALWLAERGEYYVGIPLLTLALLVGILAALYSPWGLLRHTWVLKKLVLTLANLALPVFVIGPRISRVADEPLAAWLVFGGIGAQLLLFVLATGLSIYKPKGRVGAGKLPGSLSRSRAESPVLSPN